MRIELNISQRLVVTALLITATGPLTAAAQDLTAARCTDKPPAFLLAGDSTTAVQGPDGGGWGDGFLSYLNQSSARPPHSHPGSWGANHGINGATTVSFVVSGEWARVLAQVRRHRREYACVVTIQFGHNDQLPSRGVSRAQFRANLEQFARDVRAAGGTPVLLSPLTRRDFTPGREHDVVDSLAEERLLTRAAARATGTRFVDLNKASREFVGAIGERAAQRYDSKPGDHTHLDRWGSVVFGRMVADLLLGHAPEVGEGPGEEGGGDGLVVQGMGEPEWKGGRGRAEEKGIEPRPRCLRPWIQPDRELSEKIWYGEPA